LQPIISLLTEQAFVFGREGKIAEAVAPLFVASQLGDDARTAEIADVVAWTLAEQADAALATGNTKDAVALAGLGLAAAPNVRCLLILCCVFKGRNDAAVRFFARKLVAAADRSTSPNRWGAFRYLLDVVLRPETLDETASIVAEDLRHHLTMTPPEESEQAQATVLIGELEAALRARPLPAISNERLSSPASLRDLHRREAEYHAMLGRRDLSLAYCAAYLSLRDWGTEPSDHGDAEITQLVDQAAGGTAEEGEDRSLIAQTTIAVLGRSVEALATLMERLLESGDICSLRIIGNFAASLPVVESERWLKLQFLRAIGLDWQADEPAESREARACDGMIMLTDGVLQATPSRRELRLLRARFLIERGRLDAALADLTPLMIAAPSLAAYDTLWTVMRRHWESGDIARLRAAADLAKRAPIQEHREWIALLYLCEIADHWTPDHERGALQAIAADAVMRRTDGMLRESRSPFEFRFQRTYFSVGHDLFRYALDDLVILFAALKGNETLERLYGPYIARHILYLNVAEPFPEIERVIRYLLDDPHFDPRSLLTYYLFAAQAGRMDVAYQVAGKMAEDRPEWGLVQRLSAFMEVEKQTPAVILGRAPRGKHMIYANMVCWGERFVNKMAWGSLSSLLADRNFPALCEENDVVFDIVTHIDSVPLICALPEIERLAQYCEIRLYCLPDVEDFARAASATQYFVFGHAQHFTVLRAQKDNVDVLLLASDVVYANGFLDFVRRHVSDAPRALFFDGLNCSLTPVRAALQDRRNGPVLTIDARSLAEIAVRNFKPIALHCFFDKTGASRKSQIAMIFLRKPFGFRIYSLCQALVYASAATLQGLTGFDCLAVEGKLSELVLKKISPDQLITRETMADLLWIELDDNDRWELIPLAEKNVPQVDAIVSFFRHSGRSRARFMLFDRYVDCHVDGLEHGDFIDDETEAQFLADLSVRRENDRVLRELCTD